MFFLNRITHRFRSALLVGLACAAAPVPALAGVMSFVGDAKWIFSMEVTEYQTFGPALSSGPRVGDSASLYRQSSYAGQADLDFFGPGRHDWQFTFPELSFSRSGTPVNGIVFSSDMPPSSFDETDLPDNLCGFVINYCLGDLAAGGEYEAVRYTLNINTLIPADALQRIEDPTYPASFTFTENLIFQNKNNTGDLHFFTATGASSAVSDDVSMSMPVPGAVVSLGSAMLLLASLAGLKRRRA